MTEESKALAASEAASPRYQEGGSGNDPEETRREDARASAQGRAETPGADEADVRTLKVTTWNINSVRLRMDLVARFVALEDPDVLCLQETKVEDGKFPLADVRKLGFGHVAFNGQKGYHGVATFSKIPFDRVEKKEFCAKGDARHIAIRLAEEAGRFAGAEVHNFYIPAGGDVPDPEQNPKFAHKLAFLEEMEAWFRAGFPSESDRIILVGDLNVAPLEQDVWSHRQLLDVVSHTPVETEAMKRIQASGGWVDVMRRFVPEGEKLYTWWSYRAIDWTKADRGRRLDHIWASPSIAPQALAMRVLREARSWERPSDHVPVTAVFGARGGAAPRSAPSAGCP